MHFLRLHFKLPNYLLAIGEPKIYIMYLGSFVTSLIPDMTLVFLVYKA